MFSNIDDEHVAQPHSNDVGAEMLENVLFSNCYVFVGPILDIFCQLGEPEVETPKIFLHPLGTSFNSPETKIKELGNRM